jgi:hypothetical protein
LLQHFRRHREQQQQRPPHGNSEPREQRLRQGEPQRQRQRRAPRIQARRRPRPTGQAAPGYAEGETGAQRQVQAGYGEQMRDAQLRKRATRGVRNAAALAQGQCREKWAAGAQGLEPARHAQPQAQQRRQRARTPVGSTHREQRVQRAGGRADAATLPMTPGLGTARIPQASQGTQASAHAHAVTSYCVSKRTRSIGRNPNQQAPRQGHGRLDPHDVPQYQSRTLGSVARFDDATLEDGLEGRRGHCGPRLFQRVAQVESAGAPGRKHGQTQAQPWAARQQCGRQAQHGAQQRLVRRKPAKVGGDDPRALGAEQQEQPRHSRPGTGSVRMLAQAGRLSGGSGGPRCTLACACGSGRPPAS